MNQLEYRPGLGGAAIQMDDYPAFVGTAENMRSREWAYTLGYRDLVSANRPAREVEVDFYTDYNVANALRRVADADVMAKTPGTFVAQGEWRQRGYILASTPSDIHFGRLMANMRVALLDGAWWRLASKTFMPDSGTTPSETKSGRTVVLDNAADAAMQGLTVHGESVQNGTPTPSSTVPVHVVEGANLLKNTDNLTSSDLVMTRSTVSDGIITLTSTTSTATTKIKVDYLLYGDYKNDTYTVSCDVRIAPDETSYTSKNLIVYLMANAASRLNNTSNAGYDKYGSKTTSSITSDWQRFSATFSVPSGLNSGTDNALVDGSYFTVQFATQAQRVPVNIRNIQLERGSTATPYTPYGKILLNCGGTRTPIDLQGNVLASLPDGTKDVLTVASDGSASIAKSVGVTTTASTDGVTGTVGVDVLSTTGQIADGPTVYYKLAAPQTVTLSPITMPQVSNGASVEVTAEVQPVIDVVYSVVPFLDYAFDYDYDYYVSASDNSAETSVLTPSNVRLIIYGPATNPAITIGSNVYQVNTTVPSGGYLTVDGREKTIVLTLANGTTQNAFADGVRGTGAGGGSYIFEPIKSGLQSVSWDGSFGFDLGWYEEEGEPPWNLS